MTPEDVSQSLKEQFAPIEKRFAGALFRLAILEDGSNSRRISTGRLEFSEEPLIPRPVQDYGRVILVDEWMAVDVARERIERLAGGSCSASNLTFPIQLHYINSEVKKVAGGASLSGWNDWTLDLLLQDGSRGHLLNQPLVKVGLRPFASDIEAVTNWIWPGRTDGSEPFKWRIIVIVPDTRGRFRDVAWAQDGTVTVTVEGSLQSEALEVQGISRVDRTTDALSPQEPSPTSDGKTRQVAWTIREPVASADFFLLDRRSNELLDRTTVSPMRVSVAHPSQLSIEERAKQDLTGETHEVELKPFVRVGDAKQNEILRSVIAFANSQGGRLYIGVGKDGVPDGRPALMSAVGRDAEGAEATYKRYIDSLIHERVKPVPVFVSDFFSIYGERVLLVSVPVGSAKPYSTNPGNDVYIRSGSSNRKPDPHTEWATLLPQEITWTD